MKRLVTLFMIVFLFSLGFSTGFAAENSKYSPMFTILEHMVSDENAPLAEHFDLFNHPLTGELTVAAIVKINDQSRLSELADMGLEVKNSLPSGLSTAWLPLSQYQTIAGSEAIDYVDISAKRHTLMDVSRPEIGIDDVHAGVGLPQAFLGDGVIVGIVDSGLDLNHADFRHPNGTTRVLYLQEACTGQTYTAAQINAGQAVQSDTNGHGTHVTGTAAGNHRAPNNNADYTGIAPAADLIIVKGECGGGFSDSDVINGVDFIFDHAAALDRPAVINMSLGGHFGPHDGTSNYEQALTELTGNGRIIAAAAGNEGATSLHAGYTVDFNGDYSVIEAYGGATVAVVDIWYPDDQVMDFKLSILDGALNVVDQTGWIGPGQNFEATALTGHLVAIDTEETANPNNGDHHALVAIQGNETNPLDNYFWAVGFSAHNAGTTATFDAWLVTGGQFATGVEGLGYVSGDTDKTLGIPASANNIIAVAAYNTKNSWFDAGGNPHVESFILGAKADFSSVGPTRDGRIKPEIAAPGNLIAASLSANASPPSERLAWGGYYYLIEGTSMATPHVTGVIALMLQRNPNLDYASIVSIFDETGRSDSYTQPYGALPNVVWGHGKIDGHAAVAAVSGGGEPVTVFEQGFDGAFPPSGWTLQSQQSGNETWHAGNVTDHHFNQIDPASTASAICGWIAANQNEWIMSPTFNLPSGTAALDFYAGYSTNWLNNATLKLHISTNGGSTWTQLWQAVNDSNPWGWRSFSISLNAYCGLSNLKLGWQYVGNDGDTVGLDGVELVRISSVDIEDDPSLTGNDRFYLFQNHPNPFNPVTTITFTLDSPVPVKLNVYNTAGQLVKTLINDGLPRGIHEVVWDGKNDTGQMVSSGLYFYRLKTDAEAQTKSMILLK